MLHIQIKDNPSGVYWLIKASKCPKQFMSIVKFEKNEVDIDEDSIKN